MKQYFLFSIAITLFSWIVGMIINELIKKQSYYISLSNLNFIKSEKINSIIGIGVFKWIVKNTFFRYLNLKLKMKNKIEIAELIELRKEMTYSEVSHLIGFIVVTIIAIYEFLCCQYVFAFIMMFLNILLNLYPSLLQQMNKRRIDKLIG